jgi:UDP-N-acetylmuramate dehydrogenase
MNYPKNLKTEAKFNQPLKNYTAFKIGGSAEVFIRPHDAEDLKLIVDYAKSYKITLFILGAGSNILASDKGLGGIVVKLDCGSFKNISFGKSYIQAGCGLMLSKIISMAKNRGLSGAEFLAGIPASLGGALIMNAGAWGENIGDLVENVTVMDYNGSIKTLDRTKIKFAYRKSSLAKFIILGARLRLARADKNEIGKKIKEYLARRRITHDASFPNAGCIFKNPAGVSAGRLIDECGLKGKRIGGAVVSLRHANFILNSGKASAADVLKLMNIIKRRVKHKFNADLQPEIKIWK